VYDLLELKRKVMGGLWFAWGIRWRIGRWGCMMRQMAMGIMRFDKYDELRDIGCLVPMS